MSIAKSIRQFWDDLFYSTHTKHLEEEIAYLRNEIATIRIDKDKLQTMLNDVNVAGVTLYRRDHPPKKPEQVQTPGPRRWADVVAERQKHIAEEARKALEDKAQPV